jgi:hypothetical protein
MEVPGAIEAPYQYGQLPYDLVDTYLPLIQQDHHNWLNLNPQSSQD